MQKYFQRRIGNISIGKHQGFPSTTISMRIPSEIVNGVRKHNFISIDPSSGWKYTTTKTPFGTGFYGLLATGFGSGVFEAGAIAQFDKAPVINRSQNPVLEPVI